MNLFPLLIKFSNEDVLNLLNKTFICVLISEQNYDPMFILSSAEEKLLIIRIFFFFTAENVFSTLSFWLPILFLFAFLAQGKQIYLFNIF
jgi:hypothetical protein